MQNNQKYLLPIGFYDLLDEEAIINQQSIDILLKNFSDNGYSLIKTPLMEFEESLQNKHKIDEQSFKMTDSFSGKNLVIRSDITPQIARLMSTRLQNKPLPLRLCYVGDVLKVRNDDLYTDRQLTQAGIELIGSSSPDANLEVINITADSLNKIKLPNLLFDFCIPGFLETILPELQFDKKKSSPEDLKIAIREKNISAIKKLGGKFSDSIIRLALEIIDLAAIKQELKKLPIAKNNLNKISNLEKIIKSAKQNHPDLSVTVNIFGDLEFSYHEEIGFTVFESGFSYPIARGGRYKINNKIPAAGATIYINNLRKILIGKLI